MNGKKYTVIKMDIPIYISECKVGEFKEIDVLKDHEYKVILCPNCLDGLCLMRGDLTNDEYNVEELYCYNGLRFKDELEFNNHLEMCQKPFKEDGIYEANTQKVKNIVGNLSNLSTHECRWDFTVVDDNLFKKGARAFVIVENGITIGFNAFFPLNIKDYGKRLVMWETYVFPSFRRKDRAKNLLHYAIKTLKINQLIVKSPITESGQNLLDSLKINVLAC